MQSPKPDTSMRPVRHIIVLLATAVCLSGCIGLGIHAARSVLGDKDLTAAERVRKAQEDAIAAASGGSGSVTLSWSVSSAGMRGTLTPDTTVTTNSTATAGNCKPFRQTLEFEGQTLQGSLTACPKGTDGWSIRTASAAAVAPASAVTAGRQ